MSHWFTIETITEDTFAISEYQHWEETHSYLLIGSERALLIDTGMGIADISREVSALTDKPVTAIATHVHYDHVGGHAYYADNFYVHADDLDWITGHFPLSNEQLKGYIAEPPNHLPAEFDLAHYQMFQGTPRQIVKDGDVIDLGDRKIEIIHTPGHAPGHMCFYEAERQALFTGDLIYLGTLFLFYPSTDPVAYRESVKRLLQFPVKRLLPAHHSLAISPEIIGRIAAAFDDIAAKDLLRHGSGLFDFGEFQLQI